MGKFAEAWKRQVERSKGAPTDVHIVHVRGGVQNAIAVYERKGYVLEGQTRSTTGKTTLTFRRTEA